MDLCTKSTKWFWQHLKAQKLTNWQKNLPIPEIALNVSVPHWQSHWFPVTPGPLFSALLGSHVICEVVWWRQVRACVPLCVVPRTPILPSFKVSSTCPLLLHDSTIPLPDYPLKWASQLPLEARKRAIISLIITVIQPRGYYMWTQGRQKLGPADVSWSYSRPKAAVTIMPGAPIIAGDLNALCDQFQRCR